jgi:hypothetical protein
MVGAAALLGWRFTLGYPLGQSFILAGFFSLQHCSWSAGANVHFRWWQLLRDVIPLLWMYTVARHSRLNVLLVLLVTMCIRAFDVIALQQSGWIL